MQCVVVSIPNDAYTLRACYPMQVQRRANVLVYAATRFVVENLYNAAILPLAIGAYLILFFGGGEW